MVGRDQKPEAPVGELEQGKGSGGREESNVGVIVGCTLGGVLLILVAALVAAVFLIKRRLRRKDNKSK